jgi:hypothetical protein
MQIITIVQAPYRVPSRPRLLIAKASTIWLWPGIPLTDKQGGAVCSIPPDAIRFWISKFMGPEIVSQPIPAYIASAAEYLAHGDDGQHSDASIAHRVAPSLQKARRWRKSLPHVLASMCLPCRSLNECRFGIEISSMA